jgi:hypothetical protein
LTSLLTLELLYSVASVPKDALAQSAMNLSEKVLGIRWTEFILNPLGVWFIIDSIAAIVKQKIAVI